MERAGAVVGAVVVGVDGSGRSSALRALAAAVPGAVRLPSASTPEDVDTLLSAAPGPAVLVVDDAHRRPPRVLDRLAAAVEDEQAVVLLARRPTVAGPAAAALEDAVAAAGAVVHVLAPLDEPAVADLLATRLGASPDPALARRVHEASGGRPALVVALAGWSGADADVPGALAAFVHRRRAVLPPPAAALLPVLADLDVRDEAVLAVASGLDPQAVVEALGELAESGLLATRDGGVVPAVRRALLAEGAATSPAGSLVASLLRAEAATARASAPVHLDPASLAGLGAPLEQRAELVAGVRAAQDGRAARAVEHLDRAGDAGALLAAPLRFGLGLPLQGSRPRPAGGLALWAEVASSAGRPGDALPLAIEAAETPGASLWPDSPQAMGAALAVLAADSATALRLLTAPPPAGVPAVRHRLLAAWVHLRTGRYEPAVEALAQLRGDGWLPAREALLAACLATGLARRSGDIAALRAAWATAEPLLARRAADLWQLEPLEELAVAAARLRLEHRVVPVLGLLEDALAGGGRPAAWEAASGWLRLQCAVVREDVTGAADAADRIAAAARAGTDQIAQRRVDAQAAAARAWVAALAGDVDVERVLTACALLTDAELPWEASRLAGQAAIRTTDPSAARRLLERAREGVPAQHERTPTAGAPTVLSERELEVAELVRAGRTHREIGAQLYLSPKTVEHHVARIRSKLGASTRAEFLAALAAVLPDP